MAETKKIKTALVSVFHKDGLDELLAKLKKKASKLEEAAAKAAAASEDVPEDGAVSLDTVDTSEDLEVSAEDDFEEFDPA